MTRWKKTVFALVAAMTVLSGCGLDSKVDNNAQNEDSADVQDESVSTASSIEEEKKKVELTDRQIEILELEGLPTDYYELKSIQQDAITKIELCFEYLDRTYPDDTFTYVNYEGIAVMSGRPEKLYVMSEKIGNGRCVSVGYKYVNDQYEFYDDYQMVMDSNVYEEEITKYIRSRLPDVEFFVDASIDDYVEGDSYIMERASGFFTMVMNDAFDSEEEAKAFMQSMADWIKSYGKEGPRAMLCIVFKPEDYKDATLYNYNDLDKKRHTKFRVNCSIKTDGTVRIY